MSREKPQGSLIDRLSPNALEVLRRRYLRRGPDGKPAETVEGMFRRVAHHIAAVEAAWNGNGQAAEEIFYDLLTSFRFVPNSPTFTGAGTPLGQLAACFVLPVSDDMGRRDDGIFQTLRNMALIHQTGGGTGFSFSRLRPKDTVVLSSGGKATGPVGFMRVYDLACEIVSQGGTRRGANMGVLRVDHPDIEEFITCKTDEHAINNFNISVGVTDAFMRAVENNEEWELRFPDVLHPAYRTFNGTLEEAEQAGIPIRVYKRVRARDLFDKIVRQAHRNGEPGILFLDTMNRANPCPHLGAYEATNPCGEQPLLPYENCCLGSINLARHVRTDGNGRAAVDWDLLQETVEQAVRFLDDVVDANAYVPAIPQLMEAAHRTRRIGLGIMALGDVMYMLGVRYGSEEAQELASQIMEFIRYHAMRASIALARERGPFPAIQGSVYDPEDLRWTPPSPLIPYTRLEKWGRPPLDWDEILRGIRQSGIRNAAQLTVAPTGTIATVAGCEAYGCEPVYALAYTRKVHDEGKEIELRYVSPLFLQALERAGIDEPTRERILEQVLFTGSCQDVPEVPPEIRHVFVVAGDITAEEHVRMQAALQVFVDAAISKTINFPADATPEDVARAYLLAWKLGCKGLTVYVTGSREKVVLETEAVRRARAGAGTPAGASGRASPVAPPLVPVRPRPHILEGRTYRVNTPLGTAYVTVNCNGEGEPFEVFLNVGKAGSDTAAVAEAIGRLISLVLRVPSPLPARRRLQQVVKQLRGIGGGRPTGFGRDRVQSLPDGVAQVLAEFLGLEAPPGHEAATAQLPLFPLGDLCPECGHATLVSEEGCRRCYTCGYSEC
jgi:ribonucleoside-diphosphate reductase alpha chain